MSPKGCDMASHIKRLSVPIAHRLATPPELEDAQFCCDFGTPITLATASSGASPLLKFCMIIPMTAK